MHFVCENKAYVSRAQHHIVCYCYLLWMRQKNAGVEFNISFRLVEDGSDIEIYILNQRQTKVALKRRLNEYNTDSIYMRSFEILLKTATTLYLHSLYPISPKCFFVCGFKQSRFFLPLHCRSPDGLMFNKDK